MKYDFEKIGKEKVFNELVSKTKGQIDYLQTRNATMPQKLDTLKKIKELANDAIKIGETL
jgi:hypothetical protein